MWAWLRRRLGRSDSEKQRLLVVEELGNGTKQPDGYGSIKELAAKRKATDSKQTGSRPLRDLFYFATPFDWLLLSIGSLCAVSSGVVMPVSAMILGRLTNSFLYAQQHIDQTQDWTNSSETQLQKFMQSAHTSCIYYGILGAFTFAVGYIQMACWTVSCERQINATRRAFFRSVLRQDVAWYDVNPSGSLTIKLSDLVRSNLERIKEAMGDKFGILIQSLAQFVSGWVVGVIYSWKLTLVMLAVSPVVTFCGAMISKLIAAAARKEQENYARAGAIAEEVLSAMRTVMAFNGQKREIERYNEELEKGKALGVRKAFYSGVGIGITNFVTFSVYGLAFYYGAVMILNEEIDKGTVFVVFFATMGSAFTLGQMGPQVALINSARAAATSMLNIIDRQPPIEGQSPAGRTLVEPRGRIRLHNVKFAYQTRPDVGVLDGVDLTFEPGESVALVGHSGSGKSTIVRLLLRFYDPTCGKITLDGHRLDSFNVRWLRNAIGVVAQEPVLFDMSIEDNIRLGQNDITTADIVNACKMANCHDFIRRLPRGYKSIVGERGAQMSGGQKQRIAIARTLVRNPKVLLLDEATSALDAESESVVQQALDKASEGRTTIIVAHRLSTIRHCDKIVAMEHGRVVEIGSHAELMANRALYYNLVQAQQLNDTVPETIEEEKSDTDSSEENLPPNSGAKENAGAPAKRPVGLSRLRAHRRSTMNSETGSDVSDRSDDGGVNPMRRRHRAMSRALSIADGEQERLELELDEEGAEKASLWQILMECKSQWPWLGLGMLATLVRGIIQPAFALLYSQIFSAFSKTGDELMRESTFWAMMFVVLGVITWLQFMTGEVSYGLLGENLTKHMRIKVFTNIMRQDGTFFDDPKNSTGKICTRLATDAPNVKQAISWRVTTVLSAVISMVAGIGIGLYFGWKLAMLIVAVCPLVAGAVALRFRLSRKSAMEDTELMEEAGKVAVEAIENIQTVQYLTREKEFYDMFCTHLEKPYKQAIKQAHVQSLCYAFASAMYCWIYAIAFPFGVYLVRIGDMDPVNVFRVYFGVNFSTRMLGIASSFFPEYFKAKCAAGLMFKMCDITPEIDSFATGGATPAISGLVEFSGVEFVYPSRPRERVCRGLSMRVAPGQSLALVGPSGCGKSTAVALLERFYDPLQGVIRMDSYDIRMLNVHHLRAGIALVSQEPVLFDCSIRENIIYGLDYPVSNEAVEEAAKLANIHEFVASLPMGYETRVGERGAQLSGGQKQRIAIARALVRNPKVLLLDEATSALDTESEKIVQEALDRAAAGRTSIVIAHRLSTVQHCDTIAVIRRGRIVEAGTHAELVAARGAYYNMTQRQRLD